MTKYIKSAILSLNKEAIECLIYYLVQFAGVLLRASQKQKANKDATDWLQALPESSSFFWPLEMSKCCDKKNSKGFGFPLPLNVLNIYYILLRHMPF